MSMRIKVAMDTRVAIQSVLLDIDKSHNSDKTDKLIPANLRKRMRLSVIAALSCNPRCSSSTSGGEKMVASTSWLRKFVLIGVIGVLCLESTEGQTCSVDLSQQCAPCCDPVEQQNQYNCTRKGLADYLTPGQYEGVFVNYLSFVTDTSSPNFPLRAKEFEECTGGKIVFSEANNVWVDPVKDLGSKDARGLELYDGYFMSYSHFPEASALGLAEHLNDRIRKDNARLKWEDVFPKVRAMGEYRKDGSTNIDFLMYDGDFFVPIIRLDLLEAYNFSLPNTWQEIVTLAKFFHNMDLNDDGIPDYGFCHFPRLGAGFWDYWWPEALYSTWATLDQTEGIEQGFFFDPDTMSPRFLDPGFKAAAEIWKELWNNGEEGCISDNFVTGRCAIGFSPPGCWKGVFLSPDGVSRKDEDGNVIWRPTMQNGEYAEPYRFKPFGSTAVFDRQTGERKSCTPDVCPKAERIPARGHLNDNDRARVLLPSPLQGQLINRAPFYWSGGLGTLIRKSSTEIQKDLMWDFFVYTNSPDTSVHDVANYNSWLDSWRYSQLDPGINFIEAGWSVDAYTEHAAVMQWALSDEVNGALNLRIPGIIKYTRDSVGDLMGKFIDGNITLEVLCSKVTKAWNDITIEEDKLNQLEIYRAALGRDGLSEFDLCSFHRTEMDQRDPGICRKYDDTTNIVLQAILIPVLAVTLIALAYLFFTRKKKISDSVWLIEASDLKFVEPPEVLGQGTFGFVLLAEYRGTQVAVKRVIPPKDRNEKETEGGAISSFMSGSSAHLSSEQGSPNEEHEVQNRNTKSVTIIEPHASNGDGSGTSGGRLSLEVDLEGGSFKVAEQHRSRKSAKRSSAALSWFRKGFNYRDEYEELKADFILEMRYLSKLRHPCITTVMGAVIAKKEDPMLVMEYMDHGSLHSILHNETIPVRGDMLLPMLRDIAQGMRFLHAANPQVIHGDLKAHNVLVDSKFRAKVADFGLSAKESVGATGTPLWMAPELLRGESGNTAESDVYSFGMILYEVYSRKDPYDGEDWRMVLLGVADPEIQKRPPIPPACPSHAVSLMTESLHGDPGMRPTFEEIDLRFKRLVTENVEPGHQGFGRRRAYNNNNDLRLEEVFPKHVADALREGRKVEPERRDCVTIFFSDVVGFTNISSDLAPEKISDMLDRLYTKFDTIARVHDVFKVETIGDAYMAVTNLVQDQDDHVKRMVDFSIDILHAAAVTLIDLDDASKGFVKIRIGLHCGPVVANVVGSRSPRYCLFGDAVNTASKMENSSKDMRIHISERCGKLLRKQSPKRRLLSRGKMNIKGKGQMKTFWLNHSVGSSRHHIDLDEDHQSSCDESDYGLHSPDSENGNTHFSSLGSGNVE